MAVKIGDLLVRNGLITQQQLQQALRNQQIFGGRLGTNLVEAGFVSETDLANLLSKQLGLPAAGVREFDAIDQQGLAAVPRHVAEKHRVVPLGLEDRRLRLAMSDPTDLSAVDEIAFSTGLKVDPVVAPEILITFALERSYGIPRKTRYLKVSGVTEPELQVVHVAAQEVLPLPSTGQAELVENRPRFLETERSDYAQRYTLAQGCRGLAASKDYDDVLEVLREYLKARFHKGVVLLLRAEDLVPWAQAGLAIGEQQLRQTVLPLSRSKHFLAVCQAGLPFVGANKLSEADRWLLRELGLPAQGDMICAPVLVNSRAFCLMLGVDPKRGDASDRVDECDTLAKKTSYAVQMIVFRRRILAE